MPTLIRATKCSFKHATTVKRETLVVVLAEYASVVNQFIERFWADGIPAKKDLNSSVYRQVTSWLSPTMKQIASREAVDMVRATKERDGDDAVMPVHRGRKMQLTQQVVRMGEAQTAEFDHWLTLSAIAADKTIKLVVPIKRHKHWNKLEKRGYHRLNSYVVTADGVQFAFEKKMETPKREGIAIGLDTGINALASLSNGKQLGRDIKAAIERTKRCQWGSNGHKRAQRALKQRICEVAKLVFAKKNFDLLVVESLKHLNPKTKQTRRICKAMRRSLGAWNWRLWLERLEMLAEDNCVGFWQVAPAYTSQRCRQCGHTERGNRRGENFKCLSCGCTGNADINAAENILGYWSS